MRWSIGISYFFDTRWFQIKSQIIKNLILRGGAWGQNRKCRKLEPERNLQIIQTGLNEEQK